MSEIVKGVYKALVEGNVPVKNFCTFYNMPDKDENDPEAFVIQDGKIIDIDWAEATVAPESIDKIKDELKLEIKERMKIKGAKCDVGRGYLLINPFKKEYYASKGEASGDISERNRKKISKIMRSIGFEEGIDINFFSSE